VQANHYSWRVSGTGTGPRLREWPLEDSTPRRGPTNVSRGRSVHGTYAYFSIHDEAERKGMHRSLGPDGTPDPALRTSSKISHISSGHVLHNRDAPQVDIIHGPDRQRSQRITESPKHMARGPVHLLLPRKLEPEVNRLLG
jgi:hypothetical protein